MNAYPPGPLHEHTLAHILTELDEWQREEGRHLSTNDLHQQLRDSGYGDVVTNGILQQVTDAWRRRTPVGGSPRFDTVTVDVTAHGEGWFKVEDIGSGVQDPEIPGIGLGMGHPFTEGAHIAISPDEARSLANRLLAIAHKLQPLDDQVAFATDAYEAWCRLDIEHQREFLANAIDGLVQKIGDTTVPEVCHDLANDALTIDGDVRR
jgi:hypothetical protein